MKTSDDQISEWEKSNSTKNLPKESSRNKPTKWQLDMAEKWDGQAVFNQTERTMYFTGHNRRRVRQLKNDLKKHGNGFTTIKMRSKRK